MSRLPIPDEPELPHVMWAGVPFQDNEERAALAELRRLLYSIHSEVRKFRSAIALADVGFEYVSQRRNQNPLALRRPGQDYQEHWPTIAAHSAISALFQINDILIAANTLVEDRSLYRHFSERGATSNAMAELAAAFPKATAIRHAIAHSGEITANPARNQHLAPLMRGPVVKPKGVPMLLTETFANRTFTTTRRGEILSFDVTWESYLALFIIFDRLVANVSPGNSEPQPA